MNLFNYETAKKLKDQGMDASAFSSVEAAEWVAKARSVAEMIAERDGSVTIDQVLADCPRPDGISPNATGSIFSGKNWKCIGFANSSRVSRRCGTIRIWAIKKQ